MIYLKTQLDELSLSELLFSDVVKDKRVFEHFFKKDTLNSLVHTLPWINYSNYPAL